MRTSSICMAITVLVASASALPADAQTKSAAQVVKAPVAQLWMDVATITMPGMPDMPGMGAMAGMFGGGGGGGGNAFGNTRSMSPGRYVDIALHTQRMPAGTEGTQTVPVATGLAPSLPLVPPKAEAPTPRGDRTTPESYERPKGRILFYWGCGETVRPGQPRVIDFAKAGPEEWGTFMQGRAPRERGAQSVTGNALWPNDRDRRSFSREASLVGEHAVTGDGVPAGLKFAISSLHDFMPGIALTQSGSPAAVVNTSWQPVSNAQAYFLNAMSGGNDELVFWSSSEVPDFGMGLMDYASPANIEQWLKEKVLLPTSTTQCAIPNGIFAKSQGGMLRMIAFGPELNVVYPPRPSDIKVPWEPEWAVRVRTKSTALAMLGMDATERRGGRSRSAPATGQPPADAPQDEPKMPGAVDLLKGIFGK
jgi:hypothetical protein